VQAENDIQGQQFGPVGRCIYCGSDGAPDGLRSEHIIPYSLGGNAELLEASCTKCEGLTSYLDGYLANAIYNHLRVHQNLQSRSGHPELLPADFVDAEGMRRLLLKPNDHPFFLTMPTWMPPGIVRGMQPSSDFERVVPLMWWYVPPSIRETLGLKDGETAEIRNPTRPLNLKTFGRALAKIGYCHAVANYGLTGFRPFALADIIRGKGSIVPYFVGSTMLGPPPPKSELNKMHEIAFVDLAIGRLKLHSVSIRLFGNSGTPEHGMPIYNVVVGAPGRSRVSVKPPVLQIPRVILL
jgi:hypothetical protein